jgi:hypothetical protein
MYFFINANSDLSIPNNILDAIIVEMVAVCQDQAELRIVIVRDRYAKKLQELIEGKPMISLATTSEAHLIIKKASKATAVHFGTNMNWARKHPVYFFPIAIPSDFTKLSFLSKILLKRNFNKWLAKTTKILCSNEWALSTLQNAYPECNNKIQQVNLPLQPPNQFAWNELFEVKEQLTKGNNYFLIFASAERFVAILKEFSIFKKWQQTTMNLVVVLENKQQVEKASVLLQGYKFREDIVIHTQDDVCIDWIAASYAVLWEGVDASKTKWIENAIQYDVPLLFDKQIKLPTAWLDAGEIFLFSESQALSNHFKLYYKDEVYRQSRARMGKRWMESISQEQGTQELFNKIVLSHIK